MLLVFLLGVAGVIEFCKRSCRIVGGHGRMPCFCGVIFRLFVSPTCFYLSFHCCELLDVTGPCFGFASSKEGRIHLVTSARSLYREGFYFQEVRPHFEMKPIPLVMLPALWGITTVHATND